MYRHWCPCAPLAGRCAPCHSSSTMISIGFIGMGCSALCQIFPSFLLCGSDRRWWWTMESGDCTARSDGFVLDRRMASCRINGLSGSVFGCPATGWITGPARCRFNFKKVGEVTSSEAQKVGQKSWEFYSGASQEMSSCSLQNLDPISFTNCRTRTASQMIHCVC